MAIIVKTQDPVSLLERIKSDIRKKNIQTWVLENDYFVHFPNQWNKMAKLKASYDVQSKLLFFGIHAVSSHPDIEIHGYAVYHGRFSEMLLTHYWKDIIKIEFEKPSQNMLDFYRNLI